MTTETDTLYSALGEAERYAKELEAEVSALKAENKRLKEALEPFAVEATTWDSSTSKHSKPACDLLGSSCANCGGDPDYAEAEFTVGDLRRAREIIGLLR